MFCIFIIKVLFLFFFFLLNFGLYACMHAVVKEKLPGKAYSPGGGLIHIKRPE